MPDSVFHVGEQLPATVVGTELALTTTQFFKGIFGILKPTGENFAVASKIRRANPRFTSLSGVKRIPSFVNVWCVHFWFPSRRPGA